MRNHLAYLLLVFFALSSCNNELLNSSKESITPQDEVITSSEKSTNNLICGLLQDADDLYDDLASDNLGDLEDKIDDFIAKRQAGEDPDLTSFLTNDLKIDISLLNKISNYSNAELNLLDQEIANITGNGPLTLARQSGICNVDQTRPDPCQKAIKGFVRTIGAVRETCGNCSPCQDCSNTLNDLTDAAIEVIKHCT